MKRQLHQNCFTFLHSISIQNQVHVWQTNAFLFYITNLPCPKLWKCIFYSLKFSDMKKTFDVISTPAKHISSFHLSFDVFRILKLWPIVLTTLNERLRQMSHTSDMSQLYEGKTSTDHEAQNECEEQNKKGVNNQISVAVLFHEKLFWYIWRGYCISSLYEKSQIGRSSLTVSDNNPVDEKGLQGTSKPSLITGPSSCFC